MITSFEFHSTALAIATDWRCPPDSDATGWRTDRTVVTARLRQRLAGRLLHALLVEREVPRPLAPEEHVLDDVEVVAQREVLVARSRSRARPRRAACGCARGWPSQRISPPSGVWMPGDALDQHRLAGAVVAGQRGDLAGGDVEVDVDERVHRRRSSCSTPAQPEQRRRRRPSPAPVADVRSLDARRRAGGCDAPRRTARTTLTNSSLMTVSLMFVGGDPLRRRAAPTATSLFASVSLVVPFTSAAGGSSPARRYSASAAAACASG